jgi:ankyrin repeat protein
MKARLFLLLAIIGIQTATGQELKTASWSSLPEEVKQHILSQVPTPGNIQELVNLLSTDKETQRLVNDPAFLKEFAKKTFKANADQAKALLKDAATNGNVLITKAFIDADELLKEYAAKLLLDAAELGQFGAKPDEPAKKKVIDLAETLLAAGANPNGIAGQPSTPLWEAIGANNKPLTELLLKYHADSNIRNLIGWSPLRRALYNNKLDIAKLLLEHGANPNAKDEFTGRTLLSMFTFPSNPAMIKLLLDKGADPSIADTAGHKPIGYAQDEVLRDPNNSMSHDVVELLKAAEKRHHG